MFLCGEKDQGVNEHQDHSNRNLSALNGKQFMDWILLKLSLQNSRVLIYLVIEAVVSVFVTDKIKNL
jgi:hypothetical protein